MQSSNLPAGVTRAQWLAMTAAQQLPYIFNFWKGLTATFASGVFPRTGPLLLALNFLPLSYKTSGAATNPAAVIAGKAGPYASDYAENMWYDPDGTGAITPTTIARRFALQAAATTPAAMAARWANLKAGIAAALVRAGGSSTPPSSSGSGSPSVASVSPAPPPRPSSGAAMLVGAALALFVLARLAKGGA
jgi:hypothetical protein